MIHILINRLIEREGGYVNHPDDHGGATNMGITLKTLSSWRGAPVSEEDVENLTRDEASDIYYRMYWLDPGLYTLDRGVLVEDMLFDAAVHHGPRTAISMLQRVTLAEPDGVMGPRTREAANRYPDAVLASAYLGERVAYLGRIITNNPNQAVFAAGWMNRMKGFITQIPRM
jgi:lysozyme family protein